MLLTLDDTTAAQAVREVLVAAQNAEADYYFHDATRKEVVKELMTAAKKAGVVTAEKLRVLSETIQP